MIYHRSVIFIGYLSLTVFGALIAPVSSQNASIILQVDKKPTALNRELYSNFYTLNSSSTTQFNLGVVNKNITFIIFQVHSHLLNVTLYNNTYVKGSYVSGTNVGLYSQTKKLDTFFVRNNNTDDVKVLVTIYGYQMQDPIPGGCNMEFPVPISPYLLVSYNKEYVFVDGAMAKDYTDKTCNKVSDLEVKFYRLYLPETDFSSDVYFDSLKKMLTLDSILDNGDEVPETGIMWKMRRMLGAYPGTGAIYVAVSYTITGYSVYVPTHTYACNLIDENDGCLLLDDVFSQIVCAVVLFIGVFVCYFGHRFFKTEMFLMGLVSGGLVTFIVLSIIADLDRPALVGASLLSGTFFGAIWLIYWWMYGIPVFAVLISTLNLGYLIAALVYFSLPGTLRVLEEDFNFWTFFIFIMCVTSITFISTTLISNILCCCILGAFAIIYPIDYYVGSNLKYIIINTWRRAVVDKFNRAVVAPPFQLNDAMLVIVWIGLALTGFLFQHYHNRGRPPFPPPPRSISHRMPEAVGYYGSFVPRDVRSRQFQPNTETEVQNSTERTPLLA